MEKPFIKELREFLMEKPFTKELNEFLVDRCDEIDYSQASPQFKQADGEAERLFGEIKLKLSEEDKAKFLRLDDLHNYRLAAAANAAFQKGFTEGLQFIMYLLIL